MTVIKPSYRNLNNVFDELFNSFPTTWGKEAGAVVPPVNIHETNDAYHLEIVAPGLVKEDFKINFEKGALSISYEKKSSTENNDFKTHRREYHVSNFKRTFNVDDNINVEGIQAKYENGVLKLLLPKKEEVKISPKEIAIQ